MHLLVVAVSLPNHQIHDQRILRLRRGGAERVERVAELVLDLGPARLEHLGELLGHGVGVVAPEVVGHGVAEGEAHVRGERPGAPVAPLLEARAHGAEVHGAPDHRVVVAEAEAPHVDGGVEEPRVPVPQQTPQQGGALLEGAFAGGLLLPLLLRRRRRLRLPLAGGSAEEEERRRRRRRRGRRRRRRGSRRRRRGRRIRHGCDLGALRPLDWGRGRNGGLGHAFIDEESGVRVGFSAKLLNAPGVYTEVPNFFFILEFLKN